MENFSKIAILFTNSITLLSRKIDSLITEVRNQKAPVVNLPQPKVEVQFPEFPAIKMPEFPAFPEYPKFPEIPVPIINIPEQKTPIVNLPAPIVNVSSPNVTVEPTPVQFPDKMKVEGMEKLLEFLSREPEMIDIFKEVTSKSPLPVMILDSKGKRVSDFGGGLSGPSVVGIRVGTTQVDESHPLPVTVDGFSIPFFDTEIINEALAPATTVITYKKEGVVVATKTIVVSGTTTTITLT